MDQLGNAANSIGKVIETITDISEQVNLLALNATIEAARAGDAGKGFAVVANEIKELAKQTAGATLDIKKQIEGIQGTTDGTVTSINEISQVIANVNEIVSTIATAVDEQSAATGEIASNIKQASQGIQEVNQNVNQSSSVSAEITEDIATVNQTTTDISNNSGQLSASAGELQRMAAEMNGIVGAFKI
jgi:methyl-accepting chemotaxis protein